MATFVDRVVLHAAAGDGGHGCCSIHREKFKPLGGPDGGNGGRGGDVLLRVDNGVTTLLDFHFHPHQKAGSGRPGQGSNRHGADGDDLVLAVPDGTVVISSDGEEIVDLIGPGSTYVLAHGGRGGRGNASLASTRRKAPGFAELGEPGEQLDAVLELKSVADVALVGFPSAGKSSLVSVLSAARPKIADYPFTTLVPNLGVVRAGDHPPYTVADVPGLIPGASQGRGLGLEFLRHIERCSLIVHVLDCATLEPGRDPLTDLDVIEAELAAYTTDLSDRPRLVVLNKVDVPDAAELAELVTADLLARGLAVHAVSTASHQGVRALSLALAELVANLRAAAPSRSIPRVVLRPRAVNEPDFTVRPEGEGFVVGGPKPLRWVRQTDFANEEAIGYLADRLARLGVEKELARQGAVPGVEVTIGDVTFDWEPTLSGRDALILEAAHGSGNGNGSGGNGAGGEGDGDGDGYGVVRPVPLPTVATVGGSGGVPGAGRSGIRAGAVADIPMGPRGTDQRFRTSRRPTRAERAARRDGVGGFDGFDGQDETAVGGDAAGGSPGERG